MAAIHYTAAHRIEEALELGTTRREAFDAPLYVAKVRTDAPCVPTGRKGHPIAFLTTPDRELVTCKRCLKALAGTPTPIPAEEPATPEEDTMTTDTPAAVTRALEELETLPEHHEERQIFATLSLAQTIARTIARRVTPADLGLISTREAADLLHLTERHVRRLPDLEPFLDLGGSVLYLSGDVHRLAAARDRASMAGAVRDALEGDEFLELAARAGEHHDAGLPWDEAFTIAREELGR